MSVASTRFDLDALRRAMHDGDRDAVLAMYADDAEIVVYDCNDTPSEPSTISGRERIGEMLADVFARDMTHDITRALSDGDRAAYAIACRYTDGTRVIGHSMLDLRDGLVVYEEMVQVWDE